MQICYRFWLGEERFVEQVVEVSFNRASSEDKSSSYPSWAELSYMQCPNCTLSALDTRWCPIATQIAKTVDACSDLASYEDVKLEVITPQRTYLADCTAQKALSSFFGLLIGSSECPHTQFFKPMAKFHLPLSGKEESMFRVIGTYFVTEYFKGKGQYDINNLVDIYKNLQTVNEYLAKRISGASSGDASKNAVVLLHLLSCVMPLSIQGSLKELESYLYS